MKMSSLLLYVIVVFELLFLPYSEISGSQIAFIYEKKLLTGILLQAIFFSIRISGSKICLKLSFKKCIKGLSFSFGIYSQFGGSSKK